MIAEDSRAWPVCGLCIRKVQKMTVVDEPLAHRLRIKVECHGETDVCEVDRSLIQDIVAGRAELHPGRAFPVIAFRQEPSP